MKTTCNLIDSQFTKQLLTNVKSSQRHVGYIQLDAFCMLFKYSLICCCF